MKTRIIQKFSWVIDTSKLRKGQLTIKSQSKMLPRFLTNDNNLDKNDIFQNFTRNFQTKISNKNLYIRNII